MDNFTPLKVEKKKRKVNKFLIFGNLFLVILVALIGIFYYNQTLQTTQQKAAGAPANCSGYCEKGGGKRGSCNLVESGGREYCDSQGRICHPERNEALCEGGDNDGKHCLCSTDNNCSAPGKCSNDVNPTNTPTPTPPTATNTPTPTDIITNTPTPTQTPTPTRTPTPTPTLTGTIVPSNTPTVTPTGTIVPSNTPTVTPTNTPGPSATPIPVLCGTKDCDNATNPCRSGYNCVQANDGSNYCTSPDFTDACKANPSYNSCCTAPGALTATPTEIVLAQTTVTSPPVPVTGMVQSFMYLIPALIMLVGLIL